MDNFFSAPTLIKWYKILAFVTVVIAITVCLEEPRQEVYLQPRNFNPHPYEVDINGGEKNGPVVFPSNPEDNLVEERSNFITLRNFPVRNSHPVDNHPYAKVARKHKYRVVGRFGNENKQVSERARKALAKHATQVLAYPPEELSKYKSPAHQEGKDYAFSYKVLDRLRGDDFSHSQSRSAKATNGEYRVKLPDGRVQIVSYTADKNGYKADVKYTENEGVTDQRDGPRQDPSVQIQRIPVRELYPLEEEKSLGYKNDIQSLNHNIVLLQAVVPTQISGNFNGHDGVVVTPSPAYLNAVENRGLQHQHYPKVEIFTTNARDYSTGSYVPAVSPYLQKYVGNVESSGISPEVINNGDHGLSAPTTSSSFLLADHQGFVLDNIKLVSSTPSPIHIQKRLPSTTPTPLYFSELFSTVAPHY